MTESSGWARVRELFERADEVPPAARSQWLADQCGDDEALRRRVEGLLAADDDPGETLAFETEIEPELLVDLGAEQPGAVLVGRKLGGYRTVGVLGVGGMGVVLRAEQRQPRREVALKVLAGSLVSETARRRFHFEAEVLARLQHPNIAKVYATGGEEDPVTGQPLLWIAMELVAEARPLDRFAAENALDERQRLALLLQVCDAVEYGHRQGVLHRDLKPGNVLVGDDGRPMVIDFGIARATDAGAEGHTLTGQVLGTPRYMSPEQLTGDAAAIDTRTDVYALGVLLFELLTCRAPRDPAGRSLDAFTREVMEQAPPRPSSIAPTAVDLDWVCVRAMATTPEERYGSVGELAADLRRYLASEPVSAGPPSTLYAVRRFVRRHRALVATAVAAVGFLLVGAVVSTLGWLAAARSARLARAEASTQTTITTWLTDLLQSARADQHGRDVRVVDLLDAGEVRLDDLRQGPAEVEAAVRNVMAQTWLSLDQDDRALLMIEGGMERLRELPEDHSDVAEACYLRGISLGATGKYDEAQEQLEEALALRLRNEGADSVTTAHVYHALAVNHVRTGQAPEAEPHFVRAEAIFRAELGDGDQKTLRTVSDRIDAAHQLGQYDRVRGDLVAALATAEESLGEKHPVTVSLITSKANDDRNRGESDAAESGYRRSLELSRELYGAESSDVCTILANLAVVQQDRGDFDGAETAFQRLVEIRTARGDDPLQELIARNNLASIQLRSKKAGAALDNYETLLDKAEGMIPADHWLYATFLRGRGAARTALGTFEDAEADLKRSVEVFEASLGTDNPRTRKALESMVELYEAWGRPADAASYRERLSGSR